MGIVPQIIANSIIAGTLYALVALGFNLIYSTTKFFNLAHGAIAASAAYVVFFLKRSIGLSSSLSIIIGILTAGILGYLLEKGIFLPLRKRKASSLALLVASLGIFTVIQETLAMFFSNQFRTLRAQSPRVYEIGGAAVTHIHIIFFLSALAIFILLIFFLKKTITGWAVTAISDDEEVAKVVGIHTERIIGWVFFIGSAIAGTAGIFVGFDTGLQPTMGMQLLLKGIIASIIGGIGSTVGGVLGAFFLGFVENFGIMKLSGEWKDAIAFLLMILFLIFRPSGIVKRA